MSTTVLAYFPSPPQGVWYLGSVPIRAYALCIIVGIIVALVLGDRRWVARGGEPGVVYDVALWAVPFGLVGGRLYHVITDWQTYFGPDGAGLMAALRIWDGGLGIWGAVAFGGVGAWIACRRRGIPLPAFGDAIAPGIILAQAIGRLGNYFNQELYGKETTVPWGMEIFYRRDPSGVLDVHSLTGVSTGEVAAVVHPTFLYEMLWNIAIFAALIMIDRRFRIGHGRLFALYVAGYCVGRFWIELMRADVATEFGGVRVNSFTSTFVFIGAVVYIILAPKGREAAETLRGGRPAEPLREELADLGHEVRRDLAAAAAGTGLVTAVARGSVDGAKEAAAEDLTEATAAEMHADILETDEIDVDIESVPDNIAEDAELGGAEVAAPDVSVESADELESAESDEDIDEISEDELEGLQAPVSGAPRSEQAEQTGEALDAESPESEDETESDDELIELDELEDPDEVPEQDSADDEDDDSDTETGEDSADEPGPEAEVDDAEPDDAEPDDAAPDDAEPDDAEPTEEAAAPEEPAETVAESEPALRRGWFRRRRG